MLLRDAVAMFLAARRHIVARQTWRNNEIYLRYLTEFFPNTCMADVTLHDLRRWRASLFEKNCKYERMRGTGNHTKRKAVRAKLSPYTIRGIVENCRQLFNWLVNEGLLQESPAKRLELPALPDAPPKMMAEDDLEKLIEAARKLSGRYRRARNVALLLFIRDTGCRIGGASTLRFEHLDLERGRAWVTEKGRGGGKTRAVFLKDEAIAALREWIALHPKNKKRRVLKTKRMSRTAREFVFVSERYPFAPLATHSIYDVFRSLKKKARVKGRVNPHGLRHRRAKTMLENGAPLGLVSQVLGHADIRTTHKSYGVYVVNELQAGFNKYA